MKFTGALERAAHKSSNGEMSWPRSIVPEAIREVARAGNVLLGGEVQMILKDGGTYGLLPRKSGPPGVYAWCVESKSGESWADFVLRSEKESLSAIVNIRMNPSSSFLKVPSCTST